MESDYLMESEKPFLVEGIVYPLYCEILGRVE